MDKYGAMTTKQIYNILNNIDEFFDGLDRESLKTYDGPLMAQQFYKCINSTFRDAKACEFFWKTCQMHDQHGQPKSNAIAYSIIERYFGEKYQATYLKLTKED